MNVMDLFNLSGKVALVTGGARNLGYDIALALAEAGADVAITSRKLADARKSAGNIAQATGRKSARGPVRRAIRRSSPGDGGRGACRVWADRYPREQRRQRREHAAEQASGTSARWRNGSSPST